MSSLLVLHCYLLIYFVIPSISYTCIHHNVSHPEVPKGHMTYMEMRSKRDRHGPIFEPLLIHTYVDDIDLSMQENVLFNIDVALKKVVKFFRDTMKVKRTVNPFFLERLNCAQRWKSGVNVDKCSKLKSGPEFCSTKLTEYIIPPRYLSKLELFDKTHRRPSRVIQSGQGVKDSNFILFVISRTTSWCTGNDDVQAYGSYCRLDKRNRPVAGLLNMCPSKFSKKLYKAAHYFNVIMHEVIHMLGFSLHLYPKFQTCTSVYDCETPKKIVHTDTHGVQRLVFPEVVSSMQSHFNCSEADFGAPLERYEGSGASNADQYTSHWHPLLMYTSIMTPSILEDSYVLLDNITLALLYSTGWYQVNFTKAENFILGKRQGCNFGFEEKCENSKHLCLPSTGATNCDILEYTIGKCESIVPYHPCGVYKPNKEESCLDEEGKIFALNMRSIGLIKRCVSVQEGNNSAEPTCIVMKCKTRKDVEILVNSSWVPCEVEETVKVDNVSITCPNDISSCLSMRPDGNRSFCTRDNSLAVSVRMYFYPMISQLMYNNNFKSFKVSIVQAIAKGINMPINHIINATLAVFKTMYLDFSVCPPSNMSNEELGQLLGKTQEFLQLTPFTHIFQGGPVTFPVATTKITIEPEDLISFRDYEGLIMLSIVPVVCGIFAIVTFTASVFRRIVQRYHPKRETVQMNDLTQSNLSAQRSSQSLLAA